MEKKGPVGDTKCPRTPWLGLIVGLRDNAEVDEDGEGDGEDKRSKATLLDFLLEFLIKLGGPRGRAHK